MNAQSPPKPDTGDSVRMKQTSQVGEARQITAGPAIKQDSKEPTADRAPAATPSPLPQVEHRIQKSLESYHIFVVMMVTISIFGASVFAVIAGEMTDPASIWDPRSPPFTLHTVRSFLAAAWLCFSMTIGIAGYSMSVLTLMQHRARGQLEASLFKQWEPIGLAISALIHILIPTAFLLLSLSLVAYVGTIGWAIVAFSCLALVFAFGLVMIQYWDYLYPG